MEKLKNKKMVENYSSLSNLGFHFDNKNKKENENAEEYENENKNENENENDKTKQNTQIQTRALQQETLLPTTNLDN